jgi:O-antigen ligase
LDTTKARLHRAATAIICVFLFCLSWFQQVSVISVLLLVVTWLINPDFVSSFRKIAFNRSLLLLLSFYLLHIVSLTYSSDIQYALFDLQTKLPFLFFPFFFSSFSFSDSEVSQFKKAFIAGAVVAGILCLFYAIISYMQTRQVAVFFYEQYSHFMHPAYFAVYLTLAVLFLFEIFFKPESSPLSKSFITLAISFLLANVVLLSSRTASVTALFVVVSYLLVLVFRKRIVRGDWIYILFIVLCTFFVQYRAVKKYNRFSQVTETITQSVTQKKIAPQTETGSAHELNSTTAHYLIWQNAISLVKSHPVFGVGAGDVHEELNREFMKNGFAKGAEGSFNAHNQFLNTGVALGLIGLLLLLAVLLYPALLSFQSQDWIYFFLLGVIFLNCLTEALLERQAAILVFAFFYSLFASRQSAASRV